MLDLAPVVPVVVLDDPAAAVPLARALVRGGLPVIELTLRTSSALEAVRRVVEQVPEITVGVGTVLTPAQAEAAVEAGAAFLVSPGLSPALRSWLPDSPVPLLPGVATVSEVLEAQELGMDELKLFPAVAAGGLSLLAAWASPLPTARFCPTGGITRETAAAYLALPNVGCVGGSWITPASALIEGAWSAVETLASEAAGLAAHRPGR